MDVLGLVVDDTTCHSHQGTSTLFSVWFVVVVVVSLDGFVATPVVDTFGEVEDGVVIFMAFVVPFVVL